LRLTVHRIAGKPALSFLPRPSGRSSLCPSASLRCLGDVVLTLRGLWPPRRALELIAGVVDQLAWLRPDIAGHGSQLVRWVMPELVRLKHAAGLRKSPTAASCIGWSPTRRRRPAWDAGPDGRCWTRSARRHRDCCRPWGSCYWRPHVRCGASLGQLREAGLRASVVARRRVPFGPVEWARAAYLERLSREPRPAWTLRSGPAGQAPSGDDQPDADGARSKTCGPPSVAPAIGDGGWVVAGREQRARAGCGGLAAERGPVHVGREDPL